MVSWKVFRTLNVKFQGFLHSVLWHRWLCDRKGIWPVKNLVLVCWWWQFDWSFARLIAPVVTTTSTTLRSNKMHKVAFWYRITRFVPENVWLLFKIFQHPQEPYSVIQSRKEFQRHIWIAFVDLKAAFDSVDRKALWKLLYAALVCTVKLWI